MAADRGTCAVRCVEPQASAALLSSANGAATSSRASQVNPRTFPAPGTTQVTALVLLSAPQPWDPDMALVSLSPT